MKKLGQEFKEFIMKGDALNLAVGVVIGSAFTAIVNSLVTNLITPLIELFISLFLDKGETMDDASSILSVTINGVLFNFSAIISAIITFIITGFVLFLMIKAINRAKKMTTKPVAEKEEVAKPSTEELLAEIRDLLKEPK